MTQKTRLIATCGMGVDSTALLILLKRQRRIPDAIIFADTGGEKPETYHFKKILDDWLLRSDMPKIVTVKNQRTRRGVLVETLEDDCMVGAKLPDIAYGKKGCSIEWKKKPTQKWVKENFPNDKIVWTISYNADEIRRKVSLPEFEYPLIDANVNRLGCIRMILEEGLPVPTKSACFFCPSSNKNEIRSLARKYPDLAQRAINIEKSASTRNTSVKGLGRGFDWESVITQEFNQGWLLTNLACDCVEYGVGIEEYWSQFQ